MYLALVGRIFFSSIFLLKAVDHFSDSAMQHAIMRGMPLPGFFVPVMGILALLGGLSVLLGFKAKQGAWLLVLFLLPTFGMHPFWASQDPYAAMMEHFCFLKNFSLMGSCLMVAHFGSGPYSLTR